MRDHHHFLFYSEHIEAGRLSLEPAEAHHAATVLRLNKGDLFLATDGRGTIYECKYESIAKKMLAGVILSRRIIPRHSCMLHVVAGIPERPAFEKLLADLTVLGVGRISPVVCNHCQQAWWDRRDGKLDERLKNKMVTAMKQSQYPYLPQLDPPLPIKNAGALISGFCVTADIEGIPFSEAVDIIRNQQPPFTAVIGPPGGLTADEALMMQTIGALAVNLAPTRLTTELASVVLSSLILGTRSIGGNPSPWTAA